MTEQPYRIVEGRPFLPGRRRIALLAERVPTPRVFHLLRHAACEFDVALFALADETSTASEPLLEFCSRLVLAEEPETMQELWERLPRELNVEARQVEGAQMAAYGGDLLTAPVIERTLLVPRTWRDWRQRAFLRRFRLVAAIPDGVDLDSHPPTPEPEGQCVSLAGADRGWFLDRVWPRVAKRLPRAALVSSHHEANVVVGPALEAMAIERAIVAGPAISHVRRIWGHSGLAVSNVRLTDQSRRVPRFFPPPPPEGLGLQNGVNAWIAKDAAGLADGIVQLLGDPELRRRLAQAAHRLVEERFDWNAIGALERSLLHEILDRPPTIRPACKEDVDQLDRIQRLSPEAVLWEPSAYLSYDCRVAEFGGRVAGFLVCRKLSADEAEVLSLVVDPDMRRRGLGSRLMGQVLDHRTGVTWYLEVRESNWRARNLYRKLGFEDVALRPAYYQDTGEAAVVMRLKPC